MNTAGIAGVGMGAASMGLGIATAIMQRKALKRAAREAAKYEDLKYRQFLNDAIDQNEIVTQENNARYVHSGVDTRHGTPLSVAANTSLETTRNINRMRVETEMRKRQIRLNAKAGQATAIASGVGSSLSALSSGLNVYTALGGAE